MTSKTILPAAFAAWHRRVALLALLVGSLFCFLGTAHASYASFVVDASTGQVINQVNPDELNHPASLTKMMTLYLTFQALQTGRLKLDQQLPVSAHAANMAPTKLGLRRGQTITVRDCILGMITKSANDAATVAAEALGGSEDHFVEMMNGQGLLLGMTHTHFASASGLPRPDDATTARDIGKLAVALYRDFPKQTPYFAMREFTFRGRLVRGHNHLMDRYAGMDGLKTGYTHAAGFNLASTAVREGRRLFGVVLGGRTSIARDDLMARLLDDGFEHRDTPEALVAAAGIPERPGVTRRLLAALSPISSAQADPAPAPRRVVKKSRRTLASKARHIHTKKSRGAQLACASKRHSHCASTPKRAARSAHHPRLAHHGSHVNKSVEVASRTSASTKIRPEASR